MIPLPSSGVTPQLLAAYADGELDPAARAAVERWLAEHPEARAALRAQRELSPGNAALWKAAEPPQPPEDTWAAVQEAVAEGAMPEPVTPAAGSGGRERGRARRAGLWFAAGVAAAVGAIALATILKQPPPGPSGPARTGAPDLAAAPQPEDPLAGIGVLPMASDEDVEIRRVAGNAAAWLPVGTPPFAGLLVLASADDVEVEGADPHPAWGFDGPTVTTAPGDAPMIFAAPAR